MDKFKGTSMSGLRMLVIGGRDENKIGERLCDYNSLFGVFRILVGSLLSKVGILTSRIMNRILCDTHLPVPHVISDDCSFYIIKRVFLSDVM